MDFIKDQNPTALFEVGIKSGDRLPDYVKQATMLQEEDVANLSDIAFADTYNRLHPIHTKAATYMSAVYLAGKGMQDTVEFEITKQAAEFFGIVQDIDEAIALLPTVEKSASSDLTLEKYALTFQIDEQDTWKAYPLNTEVEVTKAATDSVKDWVDDHIPTDWLFAAACNIVKRANELGIERNSIPEKIWSLGEERMVDFAIAEESINTRKQAGVADTAEYLQAVKEAAEGKISVAYAIDQWMTLDTVNGIDHKRIISPQEAFFSGFKSATVEKMAHQNVFIKDVLVPVSEMLKLSANKGQLIKMAFRKEAAEHIISLLDTLQDSNEKTASEVSCSISKLGDVQQKELLSLLLQVA
jgi:hypothetical protein